MTYFLKKLRIAQGVQIRRLEMFLGDETPSPTTTFLGSDE